MKKYVQVSKKSVLLDSPSSPLLAEPVKNMPPSSATRRA